MGPFTLQSSGQCLICSIAWAGRLCNVAEQFLVLLFYYYYYYYCYYCYYCYYYYYYYYYYFYKIDSGRMFSLVFIVLGSGLQQVTTTTTTTTTSRSTVGELFVNCRPTLFRQSADRFLGKLLVNFTLIWACF